MKDIAEKLAIFGISELWIAKIVTILVITATAHLIFRVALSKLLRVTKKTKGIWDDAIISAALRTLPALFWVIGIAAVLTVTGDHTHNSLFNYVPVIRKVGIVLCFAWFAWRWVTENGRRYLTQQKMAGKVVDHTTVDALSKLGHLFVIIVTILMIIQILGFSISGMLAVGGIGGIAVGFAAKDILANFFGGLTIYTDRPFVVGDWIRSPDKDIEGTVEAISWRYTQIRRFNKNPVYVPNALFTTAIIENPSRMTNRRIKETIGLRYDDIRRVPAIVDDIKSMLRSHTDIDTTKTLIVSFNMFNASSLDIVIEAFLHTVVREDSQDVKQEILLKIADIVEKHGADFAFPTQTLYIAQPSQEGD